MIARTLIAANKRDYCFLVFEIPGALNRASGYRSRRADKPLLLLVDAQSAGDVRARERQAITADAVVRFVRQDCN